VALLITQPELVGKVITYALAMRLRDLPIVGLALFCSITYLPL
jgi:hypothetical protein